MVAENDEHATVAPEEITTELKFRFAPEVPHEKSQSRTAPEVTNEPQVVVELATAETDPIAFAAFAPAEAAAHAVAFRVIEARSTCAPSAVSASVGCVPS